MSDDNTMEQFVPKLHMTCHVCGNGNHVRYNEELHAYEFRLHRVNDDPIDLSYERLPIYCSGSKGYLPAQFADSPMSVQRENFVTGE